jgi:RNA polymerase-binding transcription factor DksA
MAKHKKPAPHAKKTVHKKTVKPAPKKVVSAPAKKPAPKPAPTKVQAVPPKPKSAVPPSNNNKKKSNDKKENARELLRSRILGSKKAVKPIAFSLDEVREIAKTVAKTTAENEAAKAAKTTAKSASKIVDVTKTAQPAQPNHIKAASLADILGFNPKRATKPPMEVDIESVPEKFRRYYKLLLDLRTHLTAGITLHSEETLKRSSKDDSGDLSSYGQHMADAGTDTFDRDFALSLVSNEQEALTEIELAIKRIKDGTYGICEITAKPIAKERLSAVPFTRYSAEAQKDIERNRMRKSSSAGLFGELGEDGAKIEDSGGGDDE